MNVQGRHEQQVFVSRLTWNAHASGLPLPFRRACARGDDSLLFALVGDFVVAKWAGSALVSVDRAYASDSESFVGFNVVLSVPDPVPEPVHRPKKCRGLLTPVMTSNSVLYRMSRRIR